MFRNIDLTSAIYCARRPTSQRVTSTNFLGLTPEAASAETTCPDVFKVMSWAIQTSNILMKSGIPPSPKELGFHAEKQMKFLIEEPQKDQTFSLVYRDEDYSFDVEPLDRCGDSSIMINDLQLEIDHQGKIIYLWVIPCK